MNLAFITRCLFFAGFLNLMHPVHVSITNMDYIPEQNKVKLSFKVFKNDFQLLFYHLYELNVDFDDDDSYNKYQERVNGYMINHFKIKDGEENYNIKYKGIKKDSESLWFYYEADVNKNIDSIEVINVILLDLYFDQKNMLIVNAREKEQGFMFNLKKTKQIVKLNEL